MPKLSRQKASGGACKEAVETSLRPFTFVTRDTTAETLFVCACPRCPDCAWAADTFTSKANSMQLTTNVFIEPPTIKRPIMWFRFIVQSPQLSLLEHLGTGSPTRD